MRESEAWETLYYFSHRGGVRIDEKMTINVLRRTLAKVYQPRLATDDDRQMREINACIDVVEAERDRRELEGEVAVVATATMTRAKVPPRQTDPSDSSEILRQDFTDLNFIKKTIHERATRFGKAELVRAWGWDGDRFRKVIAVFGNDFTMEELGRALLYSQVNGPNPSRCEAVFLTKGEGRATRFQLIMIQMGRSCEEVSRYHLFFECSPSEPTMREQLGFWLESVRSQLRADRSRW
ncbi:MAG: hypothetical protein U1D30_22500 [Planctomycetota bacterium]